MYPKTDAKKGFFLKTGYHAKFGAIAGLLLGLFINAPALGTTISNDVSYAFTLIASTENPAFSDFAFGPPSINDVGQVGFIANQFRPPSDRHYRSALIGAGGTPVLIHAPNLVPSGGFWDQPLVPAGAASIEKEGPTTKLYFPAVGESPVSSGIAGDVGPERLMIAGYLTGGHVFTDIGQIISNAGGNVTFGASKNGVEGVFVWNGTCCTTIADTTTMGDFEGGIPSVNASGQVAFFNDSGHRIFRGDGTTIEAIAPLGIPEGAFRFWDRNPVINSQGDVAFSGVLQTFPIGSRFDAIMVGDGIDTTLIAHTSNSTLSSLDDTFSINDSSLVTFSADLIDGTRGIFVGSGAAAELVIDTNDPLFGSTVTWIGALGHEALNNNGEITFMARLADFRQVIAKATPVILPTAIPSAGLDISIVEGRTLPPRVSAADPFVFEDVPIIPGSQGSPNSPPIRYDPLVVFGYEYDVISGPNFGSMVLPDLGDPSYDLFLYDPDIENFVFQAAIAPLVTFDFTSLIAEGVDRFRILGIDLALGLDPADATAFPVGINFVDTGLSTIAVTPLNVEVSEPATLALFAFGLAGLGFVRRRRFKA